jgi:hypothetical protein
MTKFPMRNELTTAELDQVVTDLTIALKRLSEAHGFQIQLDPRMPAVEAMRNTLSGQYRRGPLQRERPVAPRDEQEEQDLIRRRGPLQRARPVAPRQRL